MFTRSSEVSIRSDNTLYKTVNINLFLSVLLIGQAQHFHLNCEYKSIDNVNNER